MTNEESTREGVRREYKKMFGLKPVFMTTAAMEARISRETKHRERTRKPKEDALSMKEALAAAGIAEL